MFNIVHSKWKIDMMKMDNDLMWKVMDDTVKEKGQSDLTLHLEGAYYNFRDMISSMEILNNSIEESVVLYKQGKFKEALDLIYKDLEVEIK